MSIPRTLVVVPKCHLPLIGPKVPLKIVDSKPRKYKAILKYFFVLNSFLILLSKRKEFFKDSWGHTKRARNSRKNFSNIKYLEIYLPKDLQDTKIAERN